MVVNNLSTDGHRVFFETSERLLNRDIDGVNDIYEWSDADPLAAPSLSLMSAGTSTPTSGPFGPTEPNVIFSISPSGNDIFFRTTDALVGGAEAGNFAIYDARVDGGFPDSAVDFCLKARCEGETPGPSARGPAAASQTFHGSGNVRPHKAPPRRCKRATKRHRGKAAARRCTAKHHHKHRAKKSKKGSK
jgi:hypothetical protein